MPRYALKIAYDGAPFSGFQLQADAPSVQGHLEDAIMKLQAKQCRVITAGRTDAGVHAMGQVVHFDMEKDWESFRLSEALNFHLKPAPIAVLATAKVDEDFSARFSALSRRYIYKILTRRAPQTFGRGTKWWVRHELDADLMQSAANIFVGKHDFTTFRSSQCQSDSPLKSVDWVRVEKIQTDEGVEIHFHIEARSFLHNQVRSFAGTLERVGAGSWPVERVKKALESCDRAKCGPVAPPEGLYLAEVKYPDDIFAGGSRDYGFA